MPELGRLTRELRARLWKPPVSEEVASEVAHHLEMLERDLIATGIAPDDARRMAKERFGNVTKIAAACVEQGERRDSARRRTAWLAEFRSDVFHALRQLRASPRFTAVAIITLAVGLGASTTIFGVANTVLLRPLPFPAPERLVLVNEVTPDGAVFPTSEPNFLDWSARLRSYAALGVFRQVTPSIPGDGGPEQLVGAAATDDFFTALGVAPTLGRTFTADEDRRGGDSRVAVIGYDFWRRRFGGAPSVLGRLVDLDGTRHRIIGVMPPGFDFPDRAVVWTPLIPSSERRRGDHDIQAVARLAHGVTQAQASEELLRLSRELSVEYPQTNAGWTSAVRPIREWYVSPRLEARVLALLATVALLLVMSCVNVANLLLSRAAAREREMAVRAALGAGRGRIMRQLLTESLVLSALGAAAGVLLSAMAMPVIRTAGSAVIPRLAGIRVDGRVLASAIPACLLTGLVFGLAPALRLARPAARGGERLHDLLRSGSRVAERGRLRNALIVTSVALATVLLVCAGLVGGSFLKLMRAELGFSPENVLTASLSFPAERYDEDRLVGVVPELTRRLQFLPGVRAAGASNIAPLSGGNTSMGFDAAERATDRVDERHSAAWRSVTPGYFASLAIPVHEGRVFDARDRFPGQRTVVINETLARQAWPGENSLGRTLKVGNGHTLTVIGVVGDTRHLVLDSVPGPTMYFPYRQFPFPSMWLTIRAAGDPLQLAGAIRREVAAIDPLLPLANIRPLDSFIRDTSAEPRLTMLIFAIFATSALVLAAVGLYGIVSYSVSRRTREIGVSMALGAQRSRIVRGVFGLGVRLAVIGVVIGTAASIAVAGLLRSILYETRPTDPLTFAAVAALLLLVTSLASLIPALRASRLDPVEALRTE